MRCYYCGWVFVHVRGLRRRDPEGRFLPVRRGVCHTHADLPALDPYFQVRAPRKP